MEGRLQIRYPVIVEGSYDRARLQSVMEGTIITTDGFGIFKKTEKLQLLRALSQKTPLLVLTDSDGAGKLIRSHITSAIPKERLIQLYVPRIDGKEKRKKEPSAEGILGVEGMERELLYKLLLPFSVDDPSALGRVRPITKADFYEDRLTGCAGCTERRAALAAKAGLPPDMTPNALLAALNILCNFDEYRALVESIA